jgi:hypothetical protein
LLGDEPLELIDSFLLSETQDLSLPIGNIQTINLQVCLLMLSISFSTIR